MNSNLALTFKNRISNLKLLPLLAGTVCLALSAGIMPVAFAQTNPPTAPPPRQQDWLNLTPEQQAKMRQIRQAAQAQMDSILTAEQRAMLQTARQNRQNRRQVFESLNLTDEQKARIQQVRRASREQIDAILTPEQRQQMQQRRQSRSAEF
jgi:periplasmic protein CpxP/Spy